MWVVKILSIFQIKFWGASAFGLSIDDYVSPNIFWVNFGSNCFMHWTSSQLVALGIVSMRTVEIIGGSDQGLTLKTHLWVNPRGLPLGSLWSCCSFQRTLTFQKLEFSIFSFFFGVNKLKSFERTRTIRSWGKNQP